MIRVQTDPIDYLCAAHGHPSTWKIDDVDVVDVEIHERRITMIVDIKPCESHVIVIRSAAGIPFWEVAIDGSKKLTRRRICLVERV